MQRELTHRIGLLLLNIAIVTALSSVTAALPAQANALQDGLDDLLEAGVDLPSETDPRTAITKTLIFVISFVSLAAIIVIIAAGIVLMVSGGSDAAVQRGRKMIVYAIIGLLVIFFAALIVSFFTVDIPTATGP